MGFKKITISFKNTKRDIALFNVMMKCDDKTYIVKELLRREFKDEIEKELKTLNYYDDLTSDILK